jgi:hypothetical protein
MNTSSRQRRAARQAKASRKWAELPARHKKSPAPARVELSAAPHANMQPSTGGLTTPR